MRIVVHVQVVKSSERPIHHDRPFEPPRGPIEPVGHAKNTDHASAPYAYAAHERVVYAVVRLTVYTDALRDGRFALDTDTGAGAAAEARVTRAADADAAAK